MSQKLSFYLEELGFTENEAEVYITLLRLGSAVVGTLAKECNIPRTTTYQVLDGLIDEGLVLKIDKENIMTYFPEEPERILYNFKKEAKTIEKKLNLGEKLIPHLIGIKNPYKNAPKVSYFEGIEGYKELLNKALISAKSTIRMISSSHSKSDKKNGFKHEELIAFEEKEFLTARLARNLELKFITTNKEKTNEFKAKDANLLRETRILPDDFGDTETILVFGDSTIIVTDNYPIIGVHIEEEQTAIMMKNIFNFIWNKSE